MSEENKNVQASASEVNGSQSSTLVQELELLLASLQRSGQGAWGRLQNDDFALQRGGKSLRTS